MILFDSFFDCGTDTAAADKPAFFAPRQVDRAVRHAT
jgi:hypothetical protein